VKILHVIPSVNPATGGPAEGVRQLCQIYQKSGGHEVDVASLDSPETIAKFNFPAKVYALGPGWGVYGYSRYAAKWFKQRVHEYDVVFINCIWEYCTFAAYRALAGSDTPYAVFTHGMLDPYFKRSFPLKHIKKVIYWHLFLERILRNASGVLFTCEEEKTLARQSFSRYRVNEIVVPFGTFPPDCDLAAATEEFLAQWPELRGKRVAVSMGRIHPKKGTDILIEAFARTLAKDPAWHLVIAGPDQIGLKKELEQLAKRLGISDRITWTGMVKGNLKWGAFAVSEVFILPSHQENFGIVVAEALAASLPVILSDKVNIWREIVSYRAGLVCEDTLEGTKAAMVRWSELSAEEIAAIRHRSKKCFDEMFSYEVTAHKALEIVEYVAHRHRTK
jgi:glycosyltransferase involved in cell wall biosynthesis